MSVWKLLICVYLSLFLLLAPLFTCKNDHFPQFFFFFFFSMLHRVCCVCATWPVPSVYCSWFYIVVLCTCLLFMLSSILCLNLLLSSSCSSSSPSLKFSETPPSSFTSNDNITWSCSPHKLWTLSFEITCNECFSSATLPSTSFSQSALFRRWRCGENTSLDWIANVCGNTLWKLRRTLFCMILAEGCVLKGRKTRGERKKRSGEGDNRGKERNKGVKVCVCMYFG